MFTIVTDCNALAQAIKKKQVNQRIAKWVFSFENYNYKIKHRSGVSMGHVDALSRCHLVTSDDIDELDLNIQITQSRDARIKALKDRLEIEFIQHFELKDGLVFKIGKNSNHFQLYVPCEMENNIIRSIHEKIGHLGVDKTTDQIKKNYWFPKLRKKVNEYIKNCVKCIIYSPASRCNEHNLYNIPKSPIPFDTIHIDHFGPLPSVRSVRKHLLVVLDGFTKHVKLYAVKTTSAKEVCASLQKYFDNFSRPRRIVSDRGACFTSSEFTEFMEKNNIKHIKVAVASPQANGQVERVNRVLKSMLAKLTEPIEHSDWVAKLANVEFAINNTVHSSTRTSPCKLLFGIEQRGRIIDELTEYIEEKTENHSRDLEKERSEAMCFIEKSQQYNLNYFLKHSVPAKTFEKGEFVVMKNVDTTVGTNKKFIPKYKGPYVIEKKLPNDRYVLKDIESFQVSQIPYDGVVESNRLRRWLAPALSPTDQKSDTDP